MKNKIIISLLFVFSTLNANNFQGPTHSAYYGNTYTQHNLARQYQQQLGTKENSHKAFKWYHKSAVKGHTSSQYQLALMFHYGSGVRKNKELAKLWFTRASKKGHAQAQSILSRFYSVQRPQYKNAYRAKYSMIYYR
ncbi:MAG: Unknown protein [uncultured Sulfurovum sp.]|uniref:beta-lactamase n=1 Tax=uncultured Sulfurovum sp. TaxID=269237 RepID=A0A6S6TY88_9BACT|nr:MAG: Unknown protein [uncultured Sulfurovum sp.]